jgi:hypothetical protein
VGGRVARLQEIPQGFTQQAAEDQLCLGLRTPALRGSDSSEGAAGLLGVTGLLAFSPMTDLPGY